MGSNPVGSFCDSTSSPTDRNGLPPGTNSNCTLAATKNHNEQVSKEGGVNHTVCQSTNCYRSRFGSGAIV
jgi:hypothetical protein